MEFQKHTHSVHIIIYIYCEAIQTKRNTKKIHIQFSIELWMKRGTRRRNVCNFFFFYIFKHKINSLFWLMVSFNFEILELVAIEYYYILRMNGTAKKKCPISFSSPISEHKYLIWNWHFRAHLNPLQGLSENCGALRWKIVVYMWHFIMTTHVCAFDILFDVPLRAYSLKSWGNLYTCNLIMFQH